MAKRRVHKVREARPKYEPQKEIVSATEFKARCLELIGRLQHSGGEVVVTRYGKPIAKLVALEEGDRPNAWGWMRGSIVEMGDIVSPTGEVWEANE